MKTADTAEAAPSGSTCSSGHEASTTWWLEHVEACRVTVASLIDDPAATTRIVRAGCARVRRESLESPFPEGHTLHRLRTALLLDACLNGVADEGGAPVRRAFERLPILDQAICWAMLVDEATIGDLAQTAEVPVIRAKARLGELEAWLPAQQTTPPRAQGVGGCSWIEERCELLRDGPRRMRGSEPYLDHINTCTVCRGRHLGGEGAPLNLLRWILTFLES